MKRKGCGFSETPGRLERLEYKLGSKFPKKRRLTDFNTDPRMCKIAGPSLEFQDKTGHKILQTPNYYRAQHAPAARRKFIKVGPQVPLTLRPVPQNTNEQALTNRRLGERRRLKENSNLHMHKLHGLLPHGMDDITPQSAYKDQGISGPHWRAENRQHTIATALPKPLQKISVSGSSDLNHVNATPFHQQFSHWRRDAPEQSIGKTSVPEVFPSKHNHIESVLGFKLNKKFHNPRKVMIQESHDVTPTVRQLNTHLPHNKSLLQLRPRTVRFENKLIPQSFNLFKTPQNENRRREIITSTLNHEYRTLKQKIDVGSNMQQYNGNPLKQKITDISTRKNSRYLHSSLTNGARNFVAAELIKCQ